ncbi:MAG: 50S ribosomal protein L25 [Chloroflexota bacterium]|nr:MAG: 50S ribosomal protein L25 [Chloroflexota bacterium]
MPDRVLLNAEKRELLGKKVGRLRRAGILPATVYGHNVTPQSIQFRAADLRPVLREAGTSQLVDLVIAGETARPVFLRQVAIDAKRNTVLHVEFFQANLREKVHTQVPIHFVGDSQAVKDGGILLTVLDHVNIESLPQDVPSGGVEVDLSLLAEMNSQLNAGELTLPPGLTLLTPVEETVVKVNPPVSEEAIEAVLAEETALPQELGGEEAQPDAVPES